MAPKDKPVELTAESTSSKKITNNKKKNDTDNPDIIKLDDALSDEDRDLKERLETCVQTILESVTIAETTTTSDTSNSTSSITLKENALLMITTELRTATASMTSVPKPLKFLRPHYAALKKYYDTNLLMSPTSAEVPQQQALQFRAKLADVMSVLAMTMGAPDGMFRLTFRCFL
jgi:26S proteasome regulatory subunit N1